MLLTVDSLPPGTSFSRAPVPCSQPRLTRIRSAYPVRRLASWTVYVNRQTSTIPEQTPARRSTTFRIQESSRTCPAAFGRGTRRRWSGSIVKERSSPWDCRRTPIVRLGCRRDGTRIALLAGTTFDLWIYDRASATLNRLTTGESSEDWPIWSRDGAEVTFYSDLGGAPGIYQLPFGGGVEPRFLAAVPPDYLEPSSWSANGDLVGVRHGRSAQADIWIIPKQGSPEPFIESPFYDGWPDLSPDGSGSPMRRTRRTGRSLHRVVSGQTREGSYLEGRRAFTCVVRIRRRDLFHGDRDLDGRRSMMMARLTLEPELRVEPPLQLFEWNDPSGSPVRGFDITRDGQRFLMIREETPAPDAVTELRVVLNWDQVLRGLVPGN